MSRFERNTVAPIPQLGRVGLETPGRAVVVPQVGSARQLADSLAASLGLAARVSTQIIAQDEQEKVVMRGTAARAAAGLLPQLRQEIADGKHGDSAFLISSDDSSLTDLAGQIAASRAGVDNEEYRQAFVDSLRPALAQELFSRKRAASVENNTALARSHSDAAVIATDEAGLEQAYQAFLKIPGATPDAAAEAVGLVALRAAAVSPDGQAKFSASKKWLGTRFAAEQAAAEATMSRTLLEAQNARQGENQEAIIGMMNNNIPSDLVGKEIDRLVKSGGLNEQRAMSLKGVLGERDAKARRESEKGVIDFVNKLTLDSDYDLAIDHADTALRTGQVDATTHSALVSGVQDRRSAALRDFYLGQINSSDSPDPSIREKIIRDSAGRPGEPRILDPQHAAALLERFDSAAARALDRQAEIQKGQIQEEMLARGMWLSKEGMNGGQALTLGIPKTQKFRLADGSVHTVSRDELIPAIQEATFQGFIRERLPDPTNATPQQAERAYVEALPDMIQWSARHGVEVAEWKQMMSIGATTTAEEFASPAGRASAMRGLTIYRAMKATNRSVLQSSLTPQAREFWDMVDSRLGETRTLTSTGAQDDAVSAMLQVRELMDSPDYPAAKGRAAATIRRPDVERLVYSEIGTPSNLGQVQDRIANMAVTKVMFSGDPETAIKSAIEDYKASHVEANGVMVPMNMRGVPESVRRWMPILSKQVIADYMVKNGKAQGYEPDDLTITVSEGTGFFYITEKNTGRYARTSRPGDTAGIQFSAQGLDTLGRDLIRRNIMTATGKATRTTLNPEFTAPNVVMPR